MRSRLRALWLSIKSSYWFIPSVLSFAAILLALGTIHLDRMRGVDWLSLFPWFEGSRPEGARAQLTVIASAMIAIASTVFAITIAAVAYASGNYGPRLLTTFMNNRGNQFSMGVFIAPFVSNLVVLRLVQDPRDTSAADGPREALPGFVPPLSINRTSVVWGKEVS